MEKCSDCIPNLLKIKKLQNSKNKTKLFPRFYVYTCQSGGTAARPGDWLPVRKSYQPGTQSVKPELLLHSKRELKAPTALHESRFSVDQFQRRIVILSEDAAKHSASESKDLAFASLTKPRQGIRPRCSGKRFPASAEAGKKLTSGANKNARSSGSAPLRNLFENLHKSIGGLGFSV